MPTSEYDELTAAERQTYLNELLRFLDAATIALETTGSEVPRGLNPSLRQLCRLYAQAIPAIRHEYGLLHWQDSGELTERYGSKQAVRPSPETGLPRRAQLASTPSEKNLADLATEAIAALRSPPSDATETLALADHYHRAAMQLQFESRLSSHSPIPESAPKPASYRTEVVRQGQRRELQDLLATRYSKDAGVYLVHALRAWRTPDAKPPVFLDSHDEISACAWHADTQTEPLYYGKLTVGPFYSPWSARPDNNPAVSRIYKEVENPVLLRLQITGEDREGARDEFELWLANSASYPAALAAADSLFEVYRV